MTQCDPSTSKEYQQLLWQGKVFFPKRGKTKQNQLVDQVRSLMKKLTTQVSGWDKDKSTALFHKTAAGTALAAGADPNGVNRHMGWKGDTQSRSYAQGDVGAYLDEQAMLAGYEQHTWRQNHHLGRTAVAVDKSWCEALLPGLVKLSNLPARKQEVQQSLQKLAEAYWQALPVNSLKYGKNFVSSLPGVQEVMQTHEYAIFSDKVLQAECDSMEELQLMSTVPYLAEWQHFKYASKEPVEVAHYSNSTHIESSQTKKQSHVRSAEAAGIVTQEPLAKRQRFETHAADKKEQHMQAEIDQLRSQNRQQELQLQLAIEKQAALELAGRKDNFKTRQLLWSAAKHGSLCCEKSKADSLAFHCKVQASSTLCIPSTLDSTLPLRSNAAAECLLPAPQSKEVVKQPSRFRFLSKPDFFQSQTIAGRYQEWIGDGHYAGIKSQLVMKKSGPNLRLGLPTTGHTKSAVDNLRRKKICLKQLSNWWYKGCPATLQSLW